KLREVYDLTRKCNFTHKQIAEKLHVSHQTVNYRISKALKVLRDELKDYLPLLAIFLLW
ncbi:MAG: sigma factor-like helix-turn-helix DNA-binding protein, partial [Bacteroides sp.]